jgi:ATP-dependent DNA helicase RecG
MVTEEKAQVAVVCADVTDAENRFLHTEPILREEVLVARLVLGAPTGAMRDAVKRGEVHVVFGTSDLLEHPIEFRRLGLVVAFEREPWGRASALHASLPAPRPDLLVFTAVPVGPRVLSTAYADHNVSVVVDPERRPALITVVRADERGRAYARVREVVGAGAQALVVVPMVDGRDAVEIPDALRLVRALEADALAGISVGLLHGAMPREERARVHDDFQHRRVQVLVSTTRVEDAPALPGAQVVVVEQADRIDQIRLHRIIGFFSRARRHGEAVLVVGELAEPDAAARIERIVAAPNGFQLTEALVVLRGIDRTITPGAPPLPRTTWLDWDADRDLVLAARDEAHRLLRADPGLRRGAHADLARELKARWTRLWPESPEWTCLLRDEPAPEPRRKRRRRRRRK